jgi:hypothetical protein
MEKLSEMERELLETACAQLSKEWRRFAASRPSDEIDQARMGHDLAERYGELEKKVKQL